MKQTIFFLIATISIVLFAEPVRSMLGADGGSMVQTDGYNLPDGIVAVEFLESTGTQWIVTDLAFSQGRLTVSGNAYSTYIETPNAFYRSFIGCSESQRVYSDGLSVAFYWAQTWAIQFHNWFNLHGSVSTLANTYFYCELDTYAGTLYRKYGTFEGTLSGDARLTRPSNGNPFVLFANGADGTGAYPCRIYDLQFMIDDELCLDLIPVRIGLEGYMYDRVSGTILANSGTGSFIIGPDL